MPSNWRKIGGFFRKMKLVHILWRIFLELYATCHPEWPEDFEGILQGCVDEAENDDLCNLGNEGLEGTQTQWNASFIFF